MIGQENWWYERKLALASIALSFVEAGCFLVSDLSIKLSLFNVEGVSFLGLRSSPMYHFVAGVWIFVTPLTLFSAALAVSLDSRRNFAIATSIANLIVIFLCSLQMLG